MTNHAGHDVRVLATPGLGLTVVCNDHSPHEELLVDPFDTTYTAIKNVVESHDELPLKPPVPLEQWGIPGLTDEEQDRFNEALTPTHNDRLCEALADCDKAIVCSHNTARLIVFALAGTNHHFAVVNEGKSIILSSEALEYLRNEGVNV